MSNLFKYTKRVLTSVLAAAVVLTAIPSSAFGAEMPDAEPEVVEVQEDFAEVAVDEEEASTVDGTSGEDEPVVIEEEENEPDKFTDDMVITYKNTGATATVAGTNSHVFLYDSESKNTGVAFYGNSTTNVKSWDSAQDYRVVVVPATGYKIDTTKDPVTIGWTDDNTSFPTYVLADTATKASGAFSYETLTEDKAVVVISKDYFSRYMAVKAVNYGFIVSANDDATVARDVSVSISSDYPAAIPASKLQAKYDSALAPISVTSSTYEISGRPITGVEIYVGTGNEETPTKLNPADPSSPDPDTDDYLWVQGTKTLTLYKAGINAGLKKGLTIKFLDENYTLTQTNKATDNELVFHESNDGTGTIINLVPGSAALQPANISAVLVTSVTGRKLKSVTIEAKNPTTGEVTLAKEDIAATTDTYAVVPKAKLLGNLEFVSNTTETVTNIVANDKYVVTTDGSSAFGATQDAETGKDFTFFVKAASGMQLTATTPVQYVQSVNGSDVTKAATDNKDGSFTIPAADMVRQTAIKINTETETTSLKAVTVALKDQTSKKTGAQIANLNDFTVTDVKYGSNLKAGANVKKDGEKFFFKVSTATSLKLSTVEYKTEDMEDAAAATVENAERGLYSIPATVVGPVSIIVDANKLVAVTVSDNSKAVVKIDGVAKKSTDTVKTNLLEGFSFSVAGADSSIKITKVGYSIGGGSYVDASALLDPDSRATTYTIAGDDVTGAISVYVQTMETATDGAGKYFVDFASSDTTAPVTDPANNVSWDYKYSTGTTKIADATDITGYKRNSDNLRVAQSATAKLTPYIKAVKAGDPKGTPVQAAAALASATYTTGSGAKTTIEAAKAASGNVAEVKAVKQGSDTLNYTLVQAATDTSTYNENLVTITGSQPIKVEPHFVVAWKAPAREYVDSSNLLLTATVKNGATDVECNNSTAVDALCISAPTYTWTPSTGKVKATVASDKLTANAATDGFTTSDPTDGVSFTFSIKDKDNEEYSAASGLTLYPVVDANYMLVPTMTVTGGGEYFKPTTGTLSVEDLNEAVITYQLYQIGSGNSISDFADQDAIDTALEEEDTSASTGWARKIDATYSFKAVSSEGDDKSTSFFGKSESGNKITVIGLAKSSYTADITGYATVGHVKVAAATISLTVDQKQNLVPVDIKLNDGVNQKLANGNIVSQKLTGSDYTNIWKSVNAPADPSKAATDPDGVSDGYQFKVVKGSALKLPEETDFDQNLFTDKTRMLTGWKVTPGAAGNVLGISGATYYKPGEEIVILDNGTTNVLVEPVWSARYTVVGIFVAEGEEEVEYTAPDGTKSKVKVPKGTALAAHDIVNINGDGKKIFLKVNKAVDTAAAAADTVTLYPEVTVGTGIKAGKVEWAAFDDVAAASGVTIAKISGKDAWASTAEETAASTNTALVPAKLSAGMLLGVEKTASTEVAAESILYAKYTGDNGAVVYSALFNDVDIDQTKVNYTLDITGLPSEIEVGETIATLANTVKIFKNTASYAGAETDKFEWTVTPSNALTIEPAAATLAGNKQPKVTGVTASTTKAKVKLTYTDVNGVSVTSAEKEITVKPASYTLALVDSKGAAIANPLIEANVGGTSNFYVQVKDSTGVVTNVTASAAGWDSSDTTVIGTSGTDHNVLLTSGLIRQGVIKEKGSSSDAAIDKLGSANLTVFVTINSKTYSLVVPAKTYYAVTFAAGNAHLATGTAVTAATVTQLATKTALSDGTTTSAVATDIVKKYYEEDLDANKKYSLDLTPYTASYSGVGNDYVAFVGWKDHTVSGGVMANTKADALKKLDKISPANVTLDPNFSDAPVTTITTNKDTIVLDNQKYAASYKENIVVNTTILNSLDKVSFAAGGAYAFVAADKKGAAAFTDDTTFDGTAFTASTTAVTYMDREAPATGDTASTYIFAVAPEANNKAGKGTFTITSQNSEIKKAVTVIVKGPFNDGKDRYMLETGEIAKDTSVTYKNTAGDEVTKFYDKDGVEITSGVVKDKDGNYYAIKGGVVQKGYVLNVDGKGNATYADPDTGKITPNKVVAIAGVNTYFIDENGIIAMPTIASGESYGLVGTAPTQYLVDAAGKILTEAAFKALGVTSVIVGGKEMVVGANDIAGPADKKIVTSVSAFTWTPEKAKDYKRGVTSPSATVTVNFKLEKAGTTDKEVLEAKVEKDSAASTTKKDVFNATVTASGYYDNKGNEYDFSKVTSSKTYNVDESGQGTSGGIEIDGLAETYKFTGAAIKPTITVVDNDLGVNLVNGVDYSLSWKNNTKITVDSSKMPTVTVNGKGNYAGKTVTGTFKIVDPKDGMSDLVAAVKKIDSLSFGSATPTYNGEAWYPETITVDGIVFEHGSGEDYTPKATGSKDVAFSFSNNVDAGTATVAATGADGKTKKKTFKIAKVDLSAAGSALVIDPDDVDWAVKGAVPNVTVTYTPEGCSAITLVPGQDFTVKVNYADRKKNVADGNKVTITGKGTNFTKKAESTETFAIEQYEITDESIISVTAFAGQQTSKVKAIVVDATGATINAKNYTLNVYPADDTDNALAATAKLVDGEEYLVKVEAPATGNLKGSGEFKFKAASDMSKAKVTLSGLAKDGVEFTGEDIDLTKVQSGELIRNLFTDGSIKVQYKNSSKQWVDLTYDEDFEVTGYLNNNKKGTMTVYISAKDGSGKVSGTKSFKVKIKAKTMKKADN